MVNPWIKLWELATFGEEAAAKIIPDLEDDGRVTLEWSDGSKGRYYFHDGDWRPEETLDSAPCDVAARDAL